MNFFSIKIQNPEIRAIAILAGTIIGAGVFALPSVFQSSGIWFSLFMLTAIFIGVFLLHYFFALIAIEGGKHRLIHYVEMFLGKKYKIIPFVTQLLGLFGTLIAYVLLGGNFLGVLFGSEGWCVWFLLYCALGVIFVVKGLAIIARLEMIFLAGVFLLVVGVLLLKINYFSVGNFLMTPVAVNQFFLLYGVSFFSLVGFSAVPEVVEVLARAQATERVKHVIFYGTFIPYIFYVIFVVAVVGLSRGPASDDGLSSMYATVGNWFMIIGPLFGFATTFTSFITVGSYVKKLLAYDLKVPNSIAIFLVGIIPFVASLVQKSKEYIAIIGFVGGILVSIEAILILLIYYGASTRLHEKYGVMLRPWIIIALIIGLFIVIDYELFSFLVR